MKVWVEKSGETQTVSVNVPTGSNIKNCIDAAGVKYITGENIFLNGLDVINGRKVDLSSVVKENDTVQIVPNYSGGCSDRISHPEIDHEFLTPSFC